jgi:CBS domain-containing protein
MPTDHLPIGDAGPAVRDAMLLEPRATPADTPLAQARETFANPRVHLMLVVDEEGRFVGTMHRDRLPAEGDGPIGDHVDADAPRIEPGAPVAEAVEMLDGTGGNRLPVVGDDGALLGLVCWDRSGQRFCVDAGRVS